LPSNLKVNKVNQLLQFIFNIGGIWCFRDLVAFFFAVFRSPKVMVKTNGRII